MVSLAKLLQDRVAEVLWTEEGFVPESDQLTRDQQLLIRDEVLNYLEDSQGFEREAPIDQDAWEEVRREAVTIHFFLRGLIKTGRVLISPK